MAIHSGWLRGSWDADTDTSLLNLVDSEEIAQAKAMDLSTNSKDPIITIADLPIAPMAPIPKRDLHITVLILPRLISYASHASHGIKSREWKETKHDGMSMKIERIAWVDEGSAKGEERGGAARRKRLRGLMEESAQRGNVGRTPGLKRLKVPGRIGEREGMEEVKIGVVTT